MYLLSFLTNLVEAADTELLQNIISTNLKGENNQKLTLIDYCLDLLEIEGACIRSDIEQTENLHNKQNISSTMPVSEIILSSHISMLIIAIMAKLSCDEILKENHSILKDNIKSKLPRQSWWFLIRILKAFIVLQEKVSDILHKIIQYFPNITFRRVSFCSKL